MAEKVGEATRANVMEIVKKALTEAGYDVLRVASGSFGVPAVEGEEETAIKIVFQIPKGERGGAGYDVYEDAQAYTFKQEEAEKKRKKKEEEKAKKIAKQNKTE
jgi:N-acetylglucosamine kinase-like BadF-type ATPase